MTSLGCGLRMCRMVDPVSEGLKGEKPPYGFGIPRLSGMYALGLGSAVDWTCEALDAKAASCVAFLSARSLIVSASLTILSHSSSASSVGGRPSLSRFRAASTTVSNSSCSAPSFRLVAWNMDSSDTVAMILRVMARSLDWYSFTRLASSRVSALPSAAWRRSLSLRWVISPRINSFSSSCSFLSFNLSSRCCVFAASSSRSGIFPSSSLQRD
mmetsp:Transcript_31318/g.56837  ORF Transcript_31318/g.56837 Transcript_31318/m.56837 type:complete len:213 (+) Transcript_31318:95-733(+)